MTEQNAPVTQSSRPNYLTGIIPTALVGAFLAANQKVQPDLGIYFGATFLPLTVATCGLMMWVNERYDIVKVAKGVAIGSLLSTSMMAGVANFGNLPSRQPESVEVTTTTPRSSACMRYNVSTGALIATPLDPKALVRPVLCVTSPAAPAASLPAPTPAG